jgi:NAD(P)-dependent dehydrogenase (short-subunit alcohol dehydrogenase family)
VLDIGTRYAWYARAVSDASIGRRFAGVAAIVTGAASGIGRATAQRLADEGAAVACVDTDGDGARAAVASIESASGNARAYRCDVTDEEQVARAFGAAEHDLGTIGVVVANAGITGPVAQIPDVTLDEWNRVLAVNLTGVFLSAKYGIPALRRNGGGALVITASNAAITSEAGWAAYAATKGGVLALGRSLGVDHAAEGIRVNCICPGAIDTPLLRSGYAAQLGEQVATDAEARLPVDAGTPRQVAAAIAFLASDEAALLNATGLVADGGSSSRMGGSFGTLLAGG